MSFTVAQNLFLGDSTTITVVKRTEDTLQSRHIKDLLRNAPDPILGIAASYDKQCRLSSIAFSTLSHALVVKMVSVHGATQHRQRPGLNHRSRTLLQYLLLCNTKIQKYTFRMDQLALALFQDFSLCITDAVDMLSATIDDRRSLQALMNVMGGEERLDKQNVDRLFFHVAESPKIEAAAQVALKAWAACRAATFTDMSKDFSAIPRINTLASPRTHIAAIASISRNADRLEALKPTSVKNDISSHDSILKKDGMIIRCDRFPTRIRKSNTQNLQIDIEGQGQVIGRVRRVKGRNAHVNVSAPLQGDKILSVTTIGREDPTCAESGREAAILAALQKQNESNILANPFFQAFWLPQEWPVPKSKRSSFLKQLSVYSSACLNRSQLTAVKKILSDEESDQIVLIQGPPGTGKTTVIASAVMNFDPSRNIWVAAQSNVAVKNIAEKFIKEGFHDFKLFVSKDFHYDWHEHLYEKLEQCFIRSDSFNVSVLEASRMLLGCKVILCTLSMLSNPNIGAFLRIVPVETVILDEASQIECGDYLTIFHRFHRTLRKLVFIGDDKQLPPYGQEDIPELRSVFEFPQLRERALFLDTQYRMPHVIGNFISRNVYDGRLGTKHKSTDPKVCRLIDVNKGRESKVGLSWVNHEEAGIVVKLAQLYESKNMAFRIITPYDAQRALIVRCLKKGKLKWEDKVFNVDSFQGNEHDHIIVSVVRSEKTGFLKNKRRTNVMLTRCKQGMVICSSRRFLLGEASDTLVGKLALLCNANWASANDVLNGRFRLSE